MGGADTGGIRARSVVAGWAAMLRWVLAAAFVLPGIDKLIGSPLRHGGAAQPFFDVLHAVGPYWRFLGLSQIVAALLLVTSRTAASAHLPP